MKFIIWDRKDGPVPVDDEGRIKTAGVLGTLEETNVYLTTYGTYEEKRFDELDVGEHAMAHFTLCGEHGVYQVWRVL